MRWHDWAEKEKYCSVLTIAGPHQSKDIKTSATSDPKIDNSVQLFQRYIV